MLALAGLSFGSPTSGEERNEFTLRPHHRGGGSSSQGIFVTMVPALLILNSRRELGVTSRAVLLAAGSLSSFLDNAPTYLTFLFLARGLTAATGLAKEVAGVPAEWLAAISLGPFSWGPTPTSATAPTSWSRSSASTRK